MVVFASSLEPLGPDTYLGGLAVLEHGQAHLGHFKEPSSGVTGALHRPFGRAALGSSPPVATATFLYAPVDTRCPPVSLASAFSVAMKWRDIAAFSPVA